jgi:hypothetical protein
MADEQPKSSDLVSEYAERMASINADPEISQEEKDRINKLLDGERVS